MITEIIYSKKFSSIPYLQEEENLSYILLSETINCKPIFTIKISSNLNQFAKDEYIKNISIPKEYALYIIKYLYENAVRPEVAIDIISDILYVNIKPN